MSKLYGEKLRPRSGAAQAIQVRRQATTPLRDLIQLLSCTTAHVWSTIVCGGDLQSIVKETIEQSPVLSSRVKELETKVMTEIDSFKKRTTETKKMLLDKMEEAKQQFNLKKSN